MALLKCFGKALPLCLFVLLPFCAPVQAEEKITLSKDESYYVLTHRMIDYGAGIGGYHLCTGDDKEARETEFNLIIEWLRINRQEDYQKPLLAPLSVLFKSAYDGTMDMLLDGPLYNIEELCDIVVPLYKRLEMPKP